MASLKKRKRIVLPSSESEDSDGVIQQAKSKPSKLQKAGSDSDAPLCEIKRDAKKELDKKVKSLENNAGRDSDDDFHLKLSSMSDTCNSDEEKALKQNCADESDAEEDVKSEDGVKNGNSDHQREMPSDSDNKEEEGEVEPVKNITKKKASNKHRSDEEAESSGSDNDKLMDASNDRESAKMARQIKTRENEVKKKSLKASHNSRQPLPSSSDSSDSDTPLSTLKSTTKKLSDGEQMDNDAEILNTSELKRTGRSATKDSNITKDVSDDSDGSKDETDEPPNKQSSTNVTSNNSESDSENMNEERTENNGDISKKKKTSRVKVMESDWSDEELAKSTRRIKGSGNKKNKKVKSKEAESDDYTSSEEETVKEAGKERIRSVAGKKKEIQSGATKKKTDLAKKAAANSSDSDSVSSLSSLSDVSEDEKQDKKSVPKKESKKAAANISDSDSVSSLSDVSEDEKQDKKSVPKKSSKKVSGDKSSRKKTNKKGDDENMAPDSSSDEENKKDSGKKKRSNSRNRSKKMQRSTETGGKKDSIQITNLKKYIRMCGLFKNYKALFEDCKSEKAKVNVLKDILREAGIQGQPTIEKCKKLRADREEAAELAALDTQNIIKPSSSGRSRRTNVHSMYLKQSPRKTLSPLKPQVDHFANLRGIISSGSESD